MNIATLISDYGFPVVAVFFLAYFIWYLYNYIVKDATTITPADGVYTFSNLPIYEGTLVNNKFTADTSNAEQRFLIENDFSSSRFLI